MAGGRFARPNASCTPSTQIDGALYFRRADIPQTGRGDAVAATWTFRRDRAARPGTAFVNGQLIIAGGYRVDTEDESRDYSFTWDEASRQWDSLPSMPHPASHSAHAVIGSCLYIIGGDEPWDGTQSNDRSTRLQIFDAATRTWSVGPSLAALNRRTPDPSDTPSHNLDWPRKWSACAWRQGLHCWLRVRLPAVVG